MANAAHGDLPRAGERKTGLGRRTLRVVDRRDDDLDQAPVLVVEDNGRMSRLGLAGVALDSAVIRGDQVGLVPRCAECGKQWLTADPSAGAPTSVATSISKSPAEVVILCRLCSEREFGGD